ncbi:MAG: FtsX-like permease family protein [Planctomycetales bacterium]|nr:FtsX-like permease family protein [Planctomycetales bacterium]
MSLWRIIVASLWHYRRIHFAVAWGVIATTAVLAGALVVGDSVRGSLRDLALDRLGAVDQVLVSENFFRPALAESLAATDALPGDSQTAAIILLRATLELPRDGETARAGGVTAIGCDEAFWRLDNHGLQLELGADEIALNQPLADQLAAREGDEVLLRVPLVSDVPSDSPLGEKTDLVAGKRLRIARIVPAQGLGQFSLRPNQQSSLCAFVDRAALAVTLEQPGRANALLVGAKDVKPEGTAADVSEQLTQALQPQADDYGLKIERVRLVDAAAPVNDYYNITSRRMMLPAALLDAAQKNLAGSLAQPALTYLANTIRLESADKQIPYSTVTGIDANTALGPYDLEGGPLADDEVVLNSWAANELGAQLGDEIAIRYYEPESTHGELVTPPPAKFRLRSIAPLAAEGDPPTRANDPHLTPELKGVTDQESIDQWDLPFELEEKINQSDEDYWDAYSTTPKAFLSLAAARRLWTSRFGDTTSLRIPAANVESAEQLFAQLDLKPSAMGLAFMPVRRQAFDAATGTTPFEGLFLGFSFFLIAAALILTLLLFRLGVQQRAREIGILSASGFTARRITGMLIRESLLSAADAAAVGVAVGVGYAWLMLWGLKTIWLAAISTPFLQLHVAWPTLLAGGLLGLVVSLAAIAWSVRKLRSVPARELLAGSTGETPALAGARSSKARVVAWASLATAVASSLFGFRLQGEAQAGAFFGSGALVLTGCLALVWTRMRSGAAGGASFSLLGLAVRNGSRNPSRSTLTIGLVAAASFLIVAISAFRLEPSAAGTGGFKLIGQTDQPVIQNLAAADGRFELAFGDADSERLAKCEIYSLRVRAGDDASCLNLYQTRQPRVLGLPPALLDRGRFGWAAVDAPNAQEQENPFLALQRKPVDDAIPAALDVATATYALKVGLGDVYTVQDNEAGALRFRIVALLKNSIFQGDLLVAEANFERLYPRVPGYRFFLFDIPGDEPGLLSEVQTSLETTLGDRGMDVTGASDRLAGFLAVQNTYLSTFQSLGALGLLLGTFGLAAVQLRSVVERRGELALMRAAGFRLRRLARLVLLENALLLLAGLVIGSLAALVAVAPHLIGQAAGLPWLTLLALLGAILVVGLLAGLGAVRATLRMPLLESLRSE